MAVASSNEIRCKRCATILRNSTVCPSCGLEVGASAGNSGAGKAVASASASGQSKRVQGKPGMKMCPVCFNSVAEAALVDHNGQKICPDCQKNLAKSG